MIAPTDVGVLACNAYFVFSPEWSDVAMGLLRMAYHLITPDQRMQIVDQTHPEAHDDMLKVVKMCVGFGI